MNQLSKTRRPAPSHLAFRRKLRCEPLEDRRMLSATLFVDADAAAGGGGLAWGTAYDDLQSALESAAAFNADGIADNDVDAIWIAEGVYRPSAKLEWSDPRSASFSLVHGVTLYGGFTGTETALDERDWTAHETVLSGDLGVVGGDVDNAYTVVYSGEDVEATVDGVTITGGNANGETVSSHPEREQGGGVFNFGSLTLRNTTFLENSAAKGGGISSSGPLIVANCTLSGNSAVGGDGGGIYSDQGTLVVTGSTLSGNTADGRYHSGGGIYNGHDALTIGNSTLLSNSADYRGGGIFSYGRLTVTDSTLWGNSVNRDYGWTGGIYSSTTSTITSCTLVGNSANGCYSLGGAVFNLRGLLTVTNSTLSANSATQGGGVYSGDLLTVNNSVVWQNCGGEIESSQELTKSPTLLIADPKFVRAPFDGGDGWGDDPDTPNIDESANDDFGDLRLTAQSPAIGYGDNESAVDASGNPLETDMDGNARICGGSVDCGAFEFQGEAPGGREAASLVVTTSEDAFDFYDGRTSLREAIYYAKSEPPGATITFDEALDGATIAIHGAELWIDRSLTVDASALGSLTIDAGGKNRVISIFAPTGSEVDLAHLTIANGRADKGGGIHVKEATVTVAYCKLLGNFARYGGGIFSDYESTLTVTNCVLVGNSAYGGQGGYGGGIYSRSDNTLTVTNCTITENWADSVGGICHSSYPSPPMLNNSIISRNRGGDLRDRYEAVVNHCFFAELFVRMPLGGGDGWGDDPDTPDIDESLNDDYGDLRLLPRSNGIDAGDNALAVDADGNPLTVDLDIVRANWGRDFVWWSLLDGDASLDSKVNSADLDIVRANWGTTAPVVAGVSESNGAETSRKTAVYGPREATNYASREATHAVFSNWARARVAWAEAVEALARERGRRKG